MRMEAGLDTGPMLGMRSIDIGADDTAKTLHDRLAALGAELIVDTLQALRAGAVREVPQPAEGVTYAAKIDKAEARIDWQQDAIHIWRRVRAFNPWPIAETQFNGAQLRIWDAEMRDSPIEAGDAAAAPGMVPGTVFAATQQGYRRRVRPAALYGFFGCSWPAVSLSPQRISSRDSVSTACASRRHGKTTAASARSLAAHAVARILREGVTLDAALKDALAAANPQLVPSVRSLSYGAVRGYYRHEAILGRLLSTPVRSLDFLVRALLSVALYELEDARTPEYAVVDAAVQTAKATDAVRAAGLINAVLRRYLRERKSLEAEIARNPATRHASPIWLADRLRADWPVRWTQLLAAGDAQAPMWLRVNAQRHHHRRLSRDTARGRHRRPRRTPGAAGRGSGFPSRRA